MKTVYKTVDPDDIDMDVIKEAGAIIKSGGLVAFPTETVYGLGGNALCAESSRKIYEAKGRPCDNPLIVHIAAFDDIYGIVKNVSPAAKALADKYWPGPLTMIFEKNGSVPSETTGGLDTVAVRFPSPPVARCFIAASGGYVAAPSANISGRPSPTSGKHVLEDMDGRIDMIIDSGMCDIGLESTIIDMTSEVPVMLRPGYVNERMLGEIVGSVEKDPAVFGDDTSKMPPKAPGMKYRHYAPKGSLAIVSGDDEAVISYITGKITQKPSGKKIAVLTYTKDKGRYEGADLVCDMGDAHDETGTASRLYDMLRLCDEKEIDEIYSEEFDTPDLGCAIMNRLVKAAGHNIIKV